MPLFKKLLQQSPPWKKGDLGGFFQPGYIENVNPSEGGCLGVNLTTLKKK